MRKIETLAARILSKESRKISFFENEYSIQREIYKDELLNEENAIEIHLIAIASFNTLFRQKDVKIFAVFMKDLKIQLKKQDSSKVTDSKSVISLKYHDFLNVFTKEKANILSSRRKHDHCIKVEKDHESKHEYAFLYNVSKAELLLIKQYLKEHFEKEFIESSTTLYVSLILFAKKTDDELKFCVNYRKLNAIIKKNRYSIVLIDETIVRLLKAK